jgi:hypothetical protein
MKFKFFNTSYFDISSISLAMSYSLNKLLKLKNINDELQKLVKDYDCGYIILYTNSGLIISDQYKEVMDTLTFEEVISSKISNDIEFFQRLKDENVEIDERTTILENTIDYVKKFQFAYQDKDVYVYLAINTSSQNISNIKKNLTEIQKILQTFFA